MAISVFVFVLSCGGSKKETTPETDSDIVDADELGDDSDESERKQG